VSGAKALIIDDDIRNIFALTAMLERGGLVVISAESGAEGIDLLSRTPDIDIVLMDIMMPVMDGYEAMRVIRRLPQHGDLPIIAVTAKVGAGEREHCLEAGASDYIPKPVDTSDLMQMLEAWLPPSDLSQPPPDAKPLLQLAPGIADQVGPSLPRRSGDGHVPKVLVIDDDFRNIFALTALLERGELDVVSAEGGAEGIELLGRTPDIGIVLMDIMMPVMDGYAAMRAIRRIPEHGDLPIIAVTAKVGEGERELCLEAGASDYIPKPVDTPELLNALSKWLPAIGALPRAPGLMD
jgi:CheY-like chemotaxis protein